MRLDEKEEMDGAKLELFVAATKEAFEKSEAQAVLGP